MPLRIDIVTLFVEMFDGFCSAGVVGRAIQRGLLEVHRTNIRDFSTDNYGSVDDAPFGGGVGMVLKCEPIFAAVEALQAPGARVLLMTPQGRPFAQATAQRLAQEQHLIFVCGHYEGVDERIRQTLVDEEISIGDYVLTNGVLPAAVVIDAVVRLLPDVLGGEGATLEESFAAGQLEYPHYTRPAEFRGMQVPEVLMSGHHAAIAKWRAEQARCRTRERRPDLLKEEGQDNDEQVT